MEKIQKIIFVRPHKVVLSLRTDQGILGIWLAWAELRSVQDDCFSETNKHNSTSRGCPLTHSQSIVTQLRNIRWGQLEDHVGKNEWPGIE